MKLFTQVLFIALLSVMAVATAQEDEFLFQNGIVDDADMMSKNVFNLRHRVENNIADEAETIRVLKGNKSVVFPPKPTKAPKEPKEPKEKERKEKEPKGTKAPKARRFRF